MNTPYLQITVDGQQLEISSRDDLALQISYTLEDGENFEQKQGSMAENIDVPATPANSKIFNAFEQPNIEDMTTGEYYKNYRPCEICVGGIVIMSGSCILESASHTRLPEKYTFSCFGNTGMWLIDMQNLTLWDCLSTTPHTFDVTTVQNSWKPADETGGFDSNEAHDFVYAPVRYRQPFGTDDTTVNIYALRPSISVYWILIRAFRKFGYTINSQFLNTANYFRRLVMPWTFGDFYDINSEITNGINFKACGDIQDMTQNEPPGLTGWGGVLFYSGSGSGSLTPSAHGSSWICKGLATDGLTGSLHTPATTGGKYVYTGNLVVNNHFRMNNTQPPNGFDTYGLYSFDDSTGTMQWVYNPPAEIAAFFGNNITAAFQLQLLLVIQSFVNNNCCMAIEVTHIFADGSPTVVTNNSIMPTGGNLVGAVRYPDSTGYPTTPTVYNFYVSNISKGDTLKFRLRCLAANSGSVVSYPNFLVFQSGYYNVNPSATSASTWQYNPVTQQWGNIDANIADNIWQPAYSFLQLTGLQVEIGGNVNFQFYDKFRSYNFLDFLRGLIDTFNLSIQTDPISQVVTIEPTHDYVLPDGTQMPGYFVPQRLDWSSKQDISKENIMQLFAGVEMQFDFSFQTDSADGGQNIFSARYKSVYLNNKWATPSNNLNNINNDNGIIAAVPGASRYIFPQRFQKGARSMMNRFFSATMHYNHTKWLNIGGLGYPAPQLICIIPENVSDTSANSITQTFTPKLAFYSGQQNQMAVGGWDWQGDPAGRGLDAAGVGIPTYNDPWDVITDAAGTQPLSSISSLSFQLPYMFAVDYTGWVNTVPGQLAPVLSYCDQNIQGSVQAGLMKSFFLKRLATMRNGKMYKPWMRLQLGDVINWEHRNAIIINGDVYNLINIDNYKPLTDDSCECTFWKVTNPTQADVDNSFPSSSSILTSPTILAQYDLKYAQLLLFMTDMPEI